MHLITGMTIIMTYYNDNCQICDTVKLLSKSVIGLQKIY